MKTVFEPGDGIITKDGYTGYVIKRLDYDQDMYEIRLASGATTRPISELTMDETDWDREQDLKTGCFSS